MKLLISWIAIANSDISMKVMFEPAFSNWVSMFLSADRALTVKFINAKICHLLKEDGIFLKKINNVYYFRNLCLTVVVSLYLVDNEVPNWLHPFK